MQGLQQQAVGGAAASMSSAHGSPDILPYAANNIMTAVHETGCTAKNVAQALAA
jgi:hypothetical protein